MRDRNRLIAICWPPEVTWATMERSIPSRLTDEALVALQVIGFRVRRVPWSRRLHKRNSVTGYVMLNLLLHGDGGAASVDSLILSHVFPKPRCVGANRATTTGPMRDRDLSSIPTSAIA